MTAIEKIQLINILGIWALCVCLLWIVGKMKYSLYVCLVRKLYWKESQCFNWLMERKYFIWCHLLAPILIFLSLGLLSQLNYGLVRIRSEITLVTSIMVWFVLCPLIISLFITAYKNDIEKT